MDKTIVMTKSRVSIRSNLFWNPVDLTETIARSSKALWQSDSAGLNKTQNYTPIQSFVRA